MRSNNIVQRVLTSTAQGIQQWSQYSHLLHLTYEVFGEWGLIITAAPVISGNYQAYSSPQCLTETLVASSLQ